MIRQLLLRSYNPAVFPCFRCALTRPTERQAIFQSTFLTFFSGILVFPRFRNP